MTNTQAKPALSQVKAEGAAKRVLSAYDAQRAATVKVGSVYLSSIYATGRTLPPMTDADYRASALPALVAEGLTARGVGSVSVQASKLKAVLMVACHAPKSGDYEGTPREGEGVDTYLERVRPFLATLAKADGTPVMPAPSNKGGAKAGKASKRKGKLKPGSRASNAAAAKSGGVTPGAVVAANSATQGQGTNLPTAKARQEARENAASVLFGQAKAADALAVLDAFADDVAKFFALKAQELRDASAKADKPAKPVTRAKPAPKAEAPKTALAAALAKAKANGKANGAATH